MFDDDDPVLAAPAGDLPPVTVARGVEDGGTHRPSARTAGVCGRCMSRTNIDLDDDAVAAVMQRFNLQTKREAVNLALRRLAAEPLDLEAARGLRGSGWDGDLDELRGSRTT